MGKTLATISPEVLRYLRNINWAVTTEHDCWGELAPPEGERAKYALYDAGEDDPPIAVFTFRNDAEAVCEALRWAAQNGSNYSQEAFNEEAN